MLRLCEVLLLRWWLQIVLLMLERLGVNDKEWDKYRGAFVLQGKPHYVEEDDKVINTKEFRGMALQSHGPQQAGRPWIGLEHTNKANKRSRYTYMEKSIKILMDFSMYVYRDLL